MLLPFHFLKNNALQSTTFNHRHIFHISCCIHTRTNFFLFFIIHFNYSLIQYLSSGVSSSSSSSETLANFREMWIFCFSYIRMDDISNVSVIFRWKMLYNHDNNRDAMLMCVPYVFLKILRMGNTRHTKVRYLMFEFRLCIIKKFLNIWLSWLQRKIICLSYLKIINKKQIKNRVRSVLLNILMKYL